MSRRYSQLNLTDRRRLFHFVERKVPIKEMARELGRHRSTIYREIRRNTFHDRELPVGDMISFGISHPCTTFDKWQLLYLVDDDYRVVEAIRTFF